MSVVQCFVPREALGPGFGKTISALVFFSLLFPVLLARQLLSNVLVPQGDAGMLLAIRFAGGAALVLIFVYFILLNYAWDALQRSTWFFATAMQGLMLLAAARLLAAHFNATGAGAGIGPTEPALQLALSFGLLTTGLMLGTVTMAMLIGHWYLVDPNIDIKWLKAACLGFGGAILLKLGSILLSLMVGALGNPFGPQGFFDEVLVDPTAIVFISARVVVGLIIAGALCVMAYKAAAIRSTQSSTGILLPAMICVLLGEMIGSYLIWGLHGLSV